MPAPYHYALGVIGVGNMGAALVAGFVKREVLAPGEVCLCDLAAERVATLSGELGVVAADDARALVSQSGAVLLAVKPQSLPDLLASLSGAFHDDQLVISIAAGVTLAKLRSLIGEGVALVRVMPNILCTVQESASAYAPSPEVSSEQLAFVDSLLASVGLALPVEEKLLDAVTGLGGSGPAFAAVFCEALADGGVAAGLPRQMAERLAAQVLVGTGRWILEKGSPAQLKDQVTSPAGTTIAGLQRLEAGGLRAAALRAVVAAADRSAELGGDSGEA